MNASEPADFDGWTCPLPLRDYERIVLGHGGGGALTAELVDHLFRPAFGTANDELHDAASLDVGNGRLAVSTDSFVVQPLFFPGGCIGDLAVNGTINDVAMSGARPLALTAGFILEEGLELSVLGRIAGAMGRAADRAGVRIVAGDTKVVESGHGDGVFITTSAVGLVPDGIDIRPRRAQSGDAVILSGPIGMHGMAVMSKRSGLEFETDITSDCAPLHEMVSSMVTAVGDDLHVLRDPTRGGVAAALCEIATEASVGISFEEARVQVPAEVRAACSFLGLDPVHVANEGKLIAIVSHEVVDDVLAAMTAHEMGTDASVIGRVTDDHPNVVVAKTPLGTRRVVDLPLGELLPRIC